MSAIRSFRDLRVWQRAMDFAVRLYRETDRFPRIEQYGLTNQMRRAAVSIPSNIAEGHVRSRREFGRFLRMALGSAAEVETQLELAHRIGYLPQPIHTELVAELTIIGKQLTTRSQKIQQ